MQFVFFFMWKKLKFPKHLEFLYLSTSIFCYICFYPEWEKGYSMAIAGMQEQAILKDEFCGHLV